MFLKSAIGSLASVLFPGPCRICGQTLITATRIPVCENCLNEFERIVDPMCAGCGRPLGLQAPSERQPLCRLCAARFYAFDRARSFAVYNDALSEAILLLKYEDVRRLGDWFAAELAKIITNAGGTWPVDAVVPVPLHKDRRRERGYNQAELIARPLAKFLGLRLMSGALLRTKPRPPRLVLSRRQHWESVRGAYAARPGAQVDNARILLVDDVLTTGATLDACARALKKAGAASVHGLTVARVRSWSFVPSAHGQANASGREKNLKGASSIQST